MIDVTALKINHNKKRECLKMNFLVHEALFFVVLYFYHLNNEK